MKTIVAISVFLLMPILLLAQNTVKVSITGFNNADGKAMVGLYNKEGEFLKNVYRSFSAKIVDGKVEGTFKDLPDGIYAISVYHDENNNNEFDRYMGFLPKEDYGNSNNVPPRFGPPKWEDAKFKVEGGTEKKIDIQMM